MFLDLLLRCNANGRSNTMANGHISLRQLFKLPIIITLQYSVLYMNVLKKKISEAFYTLIHTTCMHWASYTYTYTNRWRKIQTKKTRRAWLKVKEVEMNSLLSCEIGRKRISSQTRLAAGDAQYIIQFDYTIRLYNDSNDDHRVRMSTELLNFTNVPE